MNKNNSKKSKSTFFQNPEKVKIGTIFNGTITGYTHQGLGVTRYENRVVFVPNALCGELVTIKITDVKKNILYGQIQNLITTSPHRIKPTCALIDSCGGCALQHADYEEQLNIKEGTVKNALERLGKLENIEAKIQPIIGMDEPYHYRNKGLFRITKHGEQYSLGFLGEGSHTVADGRCTLLFPNPLNEVLTKLEQLLNTKFPPLADALSGVLTRTSFASNEIMLILLIKAAAIQPQTALSQQRPLIDHHVKTQINELFKTLKQHYPTLKVYGYALDYGENNPLYNNLTLLSPETHLVEKLNNISYQISPAAFFQVNPIQTAKLLNYIRSQLPQNQNLQIIDAYSGIGTIGLALANQAQNVHCIEIVPPAVADAKSNCHLNRLSNVSCVCGKAETLFEQVTADNTAEANNLVIVDPPRKGCHPQLLQSILEFAPETLIYVSCNPSTLARDLAILHCDYQINAVQPFDMFPQSYHVETVVLMSRKDK